MSKEKRIIGVEERVPVGQWIPLSIQHTFAMFSASVLVPWIFGINASIALLMNGIGTLFFILCTKGRAPAYLGSSFAYIAPGLLVMGTMGYEYALGGFIVSGLLLCLIAIIVKFVGTKWIDIVLPPAAMGPVVALIGLELAGSAAGTAGLTAETVDSKAIIIFLVTIVVAVFGQVILRGFASSIAILIAIVVGYVVAACTGIVDLSGLMANGLISAPTFTGPKFSLQAIIVIVPVTLTVVSEHIGHQVVTSKIVERDLLVDPGLHRSMFADGFSTALSGLCGSVPTTTYGENIGVMAVTKVYSVWVIGGAAIFSIILSFIAPASALINSIPGPVMGGISFLLYGMIGASGIRLIVDRKVNYAKARNLTMTAIVFVVGLSGISIQLGDVQLTGMSLAAFTGVFLGLVFYVVDKLGVANDKDEPDSIE